MNGIAERRRDACSSGLADATGALAAGEQMDLDLRRLRQPQRLEIVKVTLLHPAVRKSDFIEQRRAQSKDDPAFELRTHVVRIDQLAAVERAHHPIDPDRGRPQYRGIDGDLYHQREVAAEGALHRYAPSARCTERPTPAGLVRHQLEYRA